MKPGYSIKEIDTYREFIHERHYITRFHSEPFGKPHLLMQDALQACANHHDRRRIEERYWRKQKATIPHFNFKPVTLQ